MQTALYELSFHHGKSVLIWCVCGRGSPSWRTVRGEPLVWWTWVLPIRRVFIHFSSQRLNRDECERSSSPLSIWNLWLCITDYFSEAALRRTQHFNLQVCLSEYFCCSRDLWSSVLILKRLFKLESVGVWISGLAENVLGCSTTTNIPLCFVTLSQLWSMLLAFTFRRTFPESCFKVWGCFPSNIFMCGWSGVWTDYRNRFVEYAKRNQDNLHHFSPQARACAATLYSSRFVPLVLRMR